MKRVYVESFGCRASQADGAAIEASIEDRGHITERDASGADLVVLNSCTVTHSADVDMRRFVRRLHRDHPQAEILVTGCYAQRAPEELAELEGVRWVVGNSHKSQIADLISQSSEQYHGQIITSDFGRGAAFSAMPVRGTRDDRTRPNLKVQDGCSNRCSFCIIPAVRGRSRSASLPSVVEQVLVLAENYSEVVLTGINLGRWGRDVDGGQRLTDLLRTLLTDTDVKRLRISSVEPMDWSADLLELMAGEARICKHVHMPLQSGSDTVLKRMYRKYRTRHYASRMTLARELMPNAAIGTDVMTGFPGETEEEFTETVRFIESQPFTYLHVFTYSERPGTPAAIYSDSVPVVRRHERTRVLRQISERKNFDFRQKMIGRLLPAVTLEQAGRALTTNFLPVELANARRPNQLIEVEIGGLVENGLRELSLFPILKDSFGPSDRNFMPLEKSNAQRNSNTHSESCASNAPAMRQ